MSLLNTIFFFFDFISMVSHANIGAVPTFVVLKFCTYIVNLDHKSYRASWKYGPSRHSHLIMCWTQPHAISIWVGRLPRTCSLFLGLRMIAIMNHLKYIFFYVNSRYLESNLSQIDKTIPSNNFFKIFNSIIFLILKFEIIQQI